MGIILFTLKILIVVMLIKFLYKTIKNEDTSMLYDLSLNSRISINKFFSPKQLSNIEISFKKLSIPYNTLFICLFFVSGVIVFLIAFFICQIIFPLTSISIIVALPLIFLPFWIINFIAEKEQYKLERELNDFFIQLKYALAINSDIIDALRKIQNVVLEPFFSYTKQMLNEINTGKLPDKALENFAQKINIKKFSLYINNVRYCHVYGGDICSLTEKTQKTISESIKQKRKREKETRSIAIVLYMLILIDIYMYFSFIGCNKYYLNIMINSFVGQFILNINFLSIWGVVWLANILKRLDY